MTADTSMRESGPRQPISAASVLVIACGALVREVQRLADQMANTADAPGLEVECLPATLHNTPSLIADAVTRRVVAARARGHTGPIVVGYADCGTGGELDQVCADLGVRRLPGAHCYELIAGQLRFAELHQAEPGSFYLTEHLARAFDHLVVPTLGIDLHPELIPLYFGNYRYVVLLDQTGDASARAAAEQVADRLDLELMVERSGDGPFSEIAVELISNAAAAGHHGERDGV